VEHDEAPAALSRAYAAPPHFHAVLHGGSKRGEGSLRAGVGSGMIWESAQELQSLGFLSFSLGFMCKVL